MMKLLRPFRSPATPFILLALALFGPMLLRGQAMFWGTPALQFIPWWQSAWETLLSGHLPLWNPLVGMGAPLLANYQSALFYPPHWFYLIFYLIGGSSLMAWGQALMVAFHLVWAGIGMLLLLRRLGLGYLAQTVGGLAFGFCAYLVSRAGFLSINAAAAWLPWILLMLTPTKIGERLSAGRLPGLSFLLAIQLLAGHAQTAWYTILLAFMWSGFWSWVLVYDQEENEATGQGSDVLPKTLRTKLADRNLARRSKQVIRTWLFLSLALALAGGMAAVQLLPTAEYLSQSQRADAVDYQHAMNYSFWPWRLINLAAPDFFGNPAHGDYWGYSNYWEDAIYIGLLPFLLAIGALWASRNGDRKDIRPFDPAERILLDEAEAAIPQPLLPTYKSRLSRFLLLLLILALILALGKNTPIFPWLYNNVPTFDLFQAPTRYMIWAEFSLALLAAIGVQNWRRPERRTLYWTRLGTAGAFAVSLGAGLAWYMMGDVSPSFIRATVLAGLWGILVGLLSLVAPPAAAQTNENKLYPRALWQFAVLLLVSLDLGLANWGLNPSVDLDFYQQSPTANLVSDRAAGKRLYISASQEYQLKFWRFLRFDTFDSGEDWQNLRAAMLPNLNSMDNLPSANNFDPLLPGRYVDWMAFLNWAEPGSRQRMLGLMGVGLVEEVDQRTRFGVRYTAVSGGERLRWTPCAIYAADGAQAWQILTAGDLDFDRWVILEGQDQTSPPECSTKHTAGAYQTTIVRETPVSLTISVDSPSPGWLVLSDTWYPGWQVRVAGQPAPLLRANYLFQAVPVIAGVQEVQFYYRPGSFWLGALLSLVAWGVFAFLWRKKVRSDG